MPFGIGFRLNVVQYFVTIGSKTKWSGADLFHGDRFRCEAIVVRDLTLRTTADQHFPRGEREIVRRFEQWRFELDETKHASLGLFIVVELTCSSCASMFAPCFSNNRAPFMLFSIAA